MRRARPRSLLIIVAVAAGLTALAAPAWATDVTNGRIAFWDFISGQTFAVNPDGSGLVQLTHVGNGQFTQDPAWSPDGRHIVFVSNVTGARRLWVMDADGANPHMITSDRPRVNDFTPAYAPGGRRIVFTRCAGEPCAIYSIRTDGTHQHAITPLQQPPRPVFDFEPSVSPDGRRIVFTRFNANGIIAQVYVVHRDGSGALALTPPELEASSPAWSPDGERIVFSSACCKLGSRVYVMESDGSRIRRLTNEPYPNNGIGPTYAPSGTRIAFASDRRYDDFCCTDLFLMRANGGHQHRVRTGVLGAFNPAWGTAPLLTHAAPPRVRAPSVREIQRRRARFCTSVPAPLSTMLPCTS
jgi:TolB protein